LPNKLEGFPKKNTQLIDSLRIEQLLGAESLAYQEAVYLVFTPNHLRYPALVQEGKEATQGVHIITFLIDYDEDKDF
jgi:hypothetical protein